MRLDNFLSMYDGIVVFDLWLGDDECGRFYSPCHVPKYLLKCKVVSFWVCQDFRTNYGVLGIEVKYARNIKNY